MLIMIVTHSVFDFGLTQPVLRHASEEEEPVIWVKLEWIS